MKTPKQYCSNCEQKTEFKLEAYSNLHICQNCGQEISLPKTVPENWKSLITMIILSMGRII